MANRFLTIFFCLALMSPLFAQLQLDILAIDGEKAGGITRVVDGTAEIVGSLQCDYSLEEDLLVMVAWRRSNEESWWIDKNSHVVEAGIRGRQIWRFPVVALGGEFDFRKNLQVMALAVPASRPVAEGITDYHSMLFLCAAMSRPINLRRRARVHDTFRVTPRIRIDNISDRAVAGGQIQEVGLQEIFGGQARKPTISRLRLVIQPLESGEYWVMADEPLLRDGFWSAKADFVENGFDAFTDFTVLAVITRKDLPMGRGISRNEWRELLSKDIIAISPLIQTRRIAVPTAQNGIAVRILSVDEKPVRENEQREVRGKSGVKGMVSGRKLQAGESVWVLVSRQFATDGWQLLGEASIKDARYWELTPTNLGPAGTFLKLIAVVAQGQEGGVAIADIEKNLAYSKPIHIKTSETPPLIVNIESIDHRKVTLSDDQPQKTLKIARVSRIEGTLDGRNVQQNDQVWIMKMAEDDPDHWELVGKASLRNERDWVLPPLSLGEAGDELYLIAIVAPQKIERLGSGDAGRLVASSARVRVELL